MKDYNQLPQSFLTEEGARKFARDSLSDTGLIIVQSLHKLSTIPFWIDSIGSTENSWDRILFTGIGSAA